MKIFTSLLLSLLCLFPCFASAKKAAEIDISGNILIAGNEPHTYIVFKTETNEVYTLIAEKKDSFALRAAQGNIISIHGLFTAFEQDKPLPPESAGLGYLEVVSWELLNETKEIEKPEPVPEQNAKPHD
jgi:hypothetical protein